MATTSDVDITEGSGTHIAAYDITEDAVTKKVQRIGFSDSAGADALGVVGAPSADTVLGKLAALVTASEDPAPVSVSGPIQYVDVTLTTDTSAYASGDLIADTQIVAVATRANDAKAVLHSITIIDQDDQKAALYIYLLSANVSMGTENAAPSISDANALEILGPPIAIAVADYYDLGGVSIAGKDSIGKIVKPATGTDDVYVAVVNGTGTPTYTASGLKLRLGFLS